MIKLKDLLKENPFDKLGGTSDANRITGAQLYPRTGNLMKQELNIHINRAEYDTNISGYNYLTFQGNETADANTFKSEIDSINQEIESSNDPSGAYDQTRLVSDIKFDCELVMGSDKIDFTVTYDEGGKIQNVEIQDEDLAKKYGVNDQTITDYLS